MSPLFYKQNMQSHQTEGRVVKKLQVVAVAVGPPLLPSPPPLYVYLFQTPTVGVRCHRMHTFAKKCAKSFFSWKLRLFILHCSYFRWRCSWPPRILLTKGMLSKNFKNTIMTKILKHLHQTLVITH